MKKKLFTGFVFLLFLGSLPAQGLKGLLKNIEQKDSTGGISKILEKGAGNKGTLSTDEVAKGLKEALQTGVEKGTQKLSAVDGFFKDAAIKVLLPPEAQKLEKTLRGIGLGNEVDKAILSMNRAAEDAAKSAAPIFMHAIQQMTIQDAWGILKGGDSSATTYLRQKTTNPLTEAFRPVIEKSLQKVDATKYWNNLVSTYNEIPFTSKINPDLSAYVTGKALSGIFYQVALEETLIRKDPLARTTDLLKKVFGQ